MEAVVDRIEGKIAVLELSGGYFIEIPKKYLPKKIKDGDVLRITIEKDEEAKEKRINKVKAMQEKLLKRKK